MNIHMDEHDMGATWKQYGQQWMRHEKACHNDWVIKDQIKRAQGRMIGTKKRQAPSATVSIKKGPWQHEASLQKEVERANEKS